MNTSLFPKKRHFYSAQQIANLYSIKLEKLSIDAYLQVKESVGQKLARIRQQAPTKNRFRVEQIYIFTMMSDGFFCVWRSAEN